jgi:hypothetical protein
VPERAKGITAPCVVFGKPTDSCQRMEPNLVARHGAQAKLTSRLHLLLSSLHVARISPETPWSTTLTLRRHSPRGDDSTDSVRATRSLPITCYSVVALLLCRGTDVNGALKSIAIPLSQYASATLVPSRFRSPRPMLQGHRLTLTQSHWKTISQVKKISDATVWSSCRAERAVGCSSVRISQWRCDLVATNRKFVRSMTHWQTTSLPVLLHKVVSFVFVFIFVHLLRLLLHASPNASQFWKS